MRFLYCALGIFALTGLSYGYQTGLNTIYSNDKVYIIPDVLYVYQNPTSLSYTVTFPEMSGTRMLKAVPNSPRANVTCSSLPYLEAKWNQELSFFHPDCKVANGWIACYGKIEIKDHNHGSYVFVLSNCGNTAGLKDTTYELNSREVPIVSGSSAAVAAQLGSLPALLIAISLL